MSVIPLTLFFSLLLAGLFIFLFAREQRRRQSDESFGRGRSHAGEFAGYSRDRRTRHASGEP
jgi:hypothetical protein